MIFVDTSAVLALLGEDDPKHEAAMSAVRELRARHEGLLTHNYVLVESSALVQRRFGPKVLRAFLQDVVPLFEVVWVDQGVHAAAVEALLAALPTRTSLIDLVSFAVMRERGLALAFGFDADFESAGFSLVP